MDIHPIRTPDDHRAALRRIDALWGAGAGTDAGDELDMLVDLVAAYEDRAFPMAPLSPVDLIRAHMDATDRTAADLARLLGSQPRASEVLNRKRALSIEMIRRLSSEWGLPAEALIARYDLAA